VPGLAWAVLAARTVREARGVAEADLPRHFFGTWAAWDWRVPIGPIAPGSASTPGPALPPAAVSIATPTAPFRLCTERVGAAGRDLLTRELYRAWEILEAAADTGVDPWPELLSAPALHRRHAAWAIVTVRAGGGEELDHRVGRFRGRVRALLTALAEHGTPDARAWPRPFETDAESARYPIGLGRTPPDAARLAELTDRWAEALPGVRVTWADGGSVPTVR
jgi:poly(A) polymerase Pap1